MPILSDKQIFDVALAGGFSPDQAVTMTAIALAESGGDTQANLVMPGEDSIGLWQINRVVHDFGGAGDGSDPLANAIKAYEVSGGGMDIGRWTVTHEEQGAKYLQFRERAEAAAQAAGYGDAQGQWDPPFNYYSPKVAAGPAGDGTPPTLDSIAESTVAVDDAAATQADAATEVAAADEAEVETPDSDGDGLLDAYKERIGLDADAADTDQDGFADAYELQYGTDARDYFSNPLVGTAQGAEGEAQEAPPLTTELPDEPQPSEPAPPSTEPDGSPGQQAAVETAAVGTGAVPAASASVQVPQEAVPASPDALVAEGTELDTFLDAALSQQGASYIFGAPDEDFSDPNPMSDGVAGYDCSSLVRWAAARAGVDFPDGSWYQYLDIQESETELTVEEALQTPGALLFNFSEEPTAGGGRPSTAHVAISLGNGQTIEARGTKYGVGQFDAEGRDFSHAGFIPELGTEVTEELMTTFEGDLLTEPLPLLEESSVDSSGDGLLDEYKALLGLDAFSDDSDSDGYLDSYEIQYGTDPLAAESSPLVGVEPGEIPGEDVTGEDGELIDRGFDDDVPGLDDVDDGAGALAGDEADDAFGDADDGEDSGADVL